MTKIVFDKVAHSVKRHLVCEVCIKKFTRQKTFWNTVNPWNQNLDGSVKTRREILADLVVEAREWKPLPDCGKHIGDSND